MNHLRTVLSTLGGILLAALLIAANHDREMNWNPAFPSALEGWGRSAGRGHRVPPRVLACIMSQSG